MQPKGRSLVRRLIRDWSPDLTSLRLGPVIIMGFGYARLLHLSTQASLWRNPVVGCVFSFPQFAIEASGACGWCSVMSRLLPFPRLSVSSK